MWYFAYGSNMDSDRMKERDINYSTRERAILEGCQLVFNKISYQNREEGYANIEQTKNGVVEGCLYEITDKDIKIIDRYEGYPNHYNRITVSVIKDSRETIEAITYIAQPKWIDNAVKPSKGYLKHLLKAKDVLSDEYYENLKNIRTLD